jgi:hypothetical protein
MPIHRGSFGGAVNLLPSVTIGATTDFTESRGVFNATVNGNLTNTTVVFHYSTASNFSSFTSVAGSGSGTGSFSSSATVTGLSVNTTFYVRAVATSSIGAVTSGSVSFLTWSLKTLTYTSSGSFTVPTVSGVNPAALVNVLIVGGGGGGCSNGAGGGAGGYRYTTSRAFNGTSGALTITVGGGGAGGAGNSGVSGSVGGGSSISGTNLTSLAAGGGGGGTISPTGGNVGTGDNPAYVGGTEALAPGKISAQGEGGGAGVNGNGANGTINGSSQGVGGAGGAGGTINGYNFGSGGGGGFSIEVSNGPHGTPRGYGEGGNGIGNLVGGGTAFPGENGLAGLVVFSYYGP